MGLKCSRMLAPTSSPSVRPGALMKSSPMRSAPELKARPAAVSNTARIPGSDSMRSAAALSSVTSSSLSALSRSGRLSVT